MTRGSIKSKCPTFLVCSCQNDSSRISASSSMYSYPRDRLDPYLLNEQHGQGAASVSTQGVGAPGLLVSAGQSPSTAPGYHTATGAQPLMPFLAPAPATRRALSSSDHEDAGGSPQQRNLRRKRVADMTPDERLQWSRMQSRDHSRRSRQRRKQSEQVRAAKHKSTGLECF